LVGAEWSISQESVGAEWSISQESVGAERSISHRSDAWAIAGRFASHGVVIFPDIAAFQVLREIDRNR